MTLSNVIIVVCFLLIVIPTVLVACWYLADWIIPQSEIDKIDAIHKWAEKELERREVERREDAQESN